MSTLSIATVRQFCRVGTSTEDGLLRTIANSVQTQVESYTGRLLTRRTGYEQAVNGLNAPTLWPIIGPVIEIDEITAGGVVVSSYELLGDNQVLRTPEGRCWSSQLYKITATVGYETVPADLIEAMYNMCAGKYRQMGHVAGESGAGAQVSFRQWINTADFRVLQRYKMGSPA